MVNKIYCFPCEHASLTSRLSLIKNALLAPLFYLVMSSFLVLCCHYNRPVRLFSTGSFRCCHYECEILKLKWNGKQNWIKIQLGNTLDLVDDHWPHNCFHSGLCVCFVSNFLQVSSHGGILINPLFVSETSVSFHDLEHFPWSPFVSQTRFSSHDLLLARLISLPMISFG